MADPRILSRRDSHSHSDVSDAVSSSTSPRDTDPSASAAPAPVMRSGPPGQRTLLVPDVNAPTLPAHGAPVAALAVLQQATCPATPIAAPSEWAWDARAGILTLNKVFIFEEEIRDLLENYPDAQHVVVQPDLVTDSALRLIGLLGAATKVTSIHFSRPINSRGGTDARPYLDSHSAEALADLVKKNPALTKLAFSKCPYITSEFFNALANHLKDNLTVVAIEISNSGDVPMEQTESLLGQAIAGLLSKNRGVRTVIAPANRISGSGAAAIGAALARNKSLTTLDLGFNGIDSDGARALFDGLRKNKKTALSRLDLSRCAMDERSAKSLAKLLKKNTSMTEIIVGNVKDPEGRRHIANGVSANKSGCNVRFA